MNIHQVFVGVITLIWVTCGFAQTDPSQVTNVRRAEMVMTLWRETCASNFSNPTAIHAKAAQYLFAKNPSYSKEMLKGREGTVWDVSLGPNATNVLLLLEDASASCQIYAKRTDSDVVNTQFTKIVEGAASGPVTAEKLVDRIHEQAGVKLRQIAYFVARAGEKVGWAFVATTNESDQAQWQTVITVSRTQKP